MKLPSTTLKPFMHRLGRGAGAILTKHYQKKHRIKYKPNAGIVTEADLEAEDFIIREIQKTFPHSSIVSEESGPIRRDDSLCWVIDPLDGTSNYAHRFGYFCVSIGLLENGALRAGLIHQPLNQDMYWAEKNQGAYLNGQRLRVSKTKRIRDSLLGTGFYYTTGSTLGKELEIFRRVQEKARAVRRPGSAALDLAMVASGVYDAFWERGLSSWDVAAGILLVEEAGGQVTNYRGKVAELEGREVLASNTLLHGTLMRLITGRR
jgi:myo-inositol-1(or 4)-monophosphatase